MFDEKKEYKCEVCGSTEGIMLCRDLLEVVDEAGNPLYHEVCDGKIKQLCRKHREERKPIRKDHITLTQLTSLLKSIDVERMENNQKNYNWLKRLLQNCLQGLH